MNQIDRLIIKVYKDYPCLSPSRYESFYVLTKFIKARFLRKDKILEIGCGSGINALLLDNLLTQKSCYNGIDLEFKGSTKIIKRKLKRIKANFKHMDARKLFFKKSSFDLVLSLWSLEHIQDDIKALREAYRVLKNGGIILLAVPSIFTFPFQLGRHGFHYYKKEGIITKLKKAGFRIKRVSSLGGFFGFLFSLFQNWLDLLILAPFGLFFKIFAHEKLKGDSRQDLGGGLAKKITSYTTCLYRKTLIGRKIHFNILRLIRIIDNYFPIFPASYFLMAEK